jgi:HAD superfamily hydrolase (TIGR01509 family)
MHELTQRTAEAFFSSIKAMPGVAERLEELYQAKIPMALVTASPRVMADNVSAALGAHYFQSIVSTDDVVNSKPDPEGYLKAARQLNVDIEKCLIFEDSNTGVRAGQASGASVVGLTHLTKYEPHPRTVAIASIESISHRSLNDFYIAKTNKAEE